MRETHDVLLLWTLGQLFLTKINTGGTSCDLLNRGRAEVRFKSSRLVVRAARRGAPMGLRPMSRYKGRTKPTLIERDFPHHVEVLVPPGGLGKKLDAMHDWHRAKGIEAMRGRSRRDENGHNYIRWCFADPEIAKAFASEFGSS